MQEKVIKLHKFRRSFYNTDSKIHRFKRKRLIKKRNLFCALQLLFNAKSTQLQGYFYSHIKSKICERFIGLG